MGQAAVIALGEVIGSEAAAGFIVSFATSVAISYAINAVFAQPPKRPEFKGEFDGRTQTSIEPGAPWEYVYGQVRKGGKIVFRHGTSPLNHPLGDNFNIPTTAPYTWVTQPPNFVAAVRTDFTTYDAEDGESRAPVTLVASNPAPGEYSVQATLIDGVARGVYTFNAADAGKEVGVLYTSAGPVVVQSVLHLVIVWAAHEVEEIGDLYFNDELVPLDGNGDATGRLVGHVYASHHLGPAGQAADARLMSEAPDKWTADHRLRGHAYSYLRLARNLNLFPAGVPNISVVLKGKKVYDPRSGLTVWSPTASLCQADYFNDPKIGLNCAYGTRIDTTLLTAAANVDDEDVALAAGGTEKRYTANGVVSAANVPEDNLGKFLTANVGHAVYLGGQWRLRSGAYITPTVTLDEGDLRAPISVSTRLSRKDACNGVKGLYVSPEKNWQPSDFPPIASSTFLAEDNNERNWLDIELPFTSSAPRAQRIAKINLLKRRQQISASMPFKLTAYRAEPPETEMINNTRFGWSAKVFEVNESRLVFGPGEIGVDHALRETSSTIYDWSTSEEQAEDPAPDTNLPMPFAVAPPGTPVVVESLYVTRDGTAVRTKAAVSWSPSPDGQAQTYDLEWKLKAAADWQKQHGLRGPLTEVLDLDAAVYQFRVLARSAIGVRSLWSQIEKEIIGLGAIPGDVQSFAVRVVSGQALVTLTKAIDVDVLIGGRIVVRWSPLSAGATWNDGMLLSSEHFPGDAVSFFAPLLPGTYLAKFQDSVGLYSLNAASFVLTEAHMTGFTTLGTATEHPAFTGAKVNTAAVDGGVQLVGATLWDDLPNIDSVDMIDAAGGIVPSGSYTFANRIDLGSVLTVRLFPNVKSFGFDTGDLWDSRTDPIDSWGLVDGGVIEDAEVALEVRTTNDNPSGSPTWGPWHALPGQADYNARAFEFRVQHTSGTVTHNRSVTELSVAAKQPT
jgi:hypothetical protein